MNIYRLSILVLLGLFLLSTVVIAGENKYAGTTGKHALRITIGARQAAMGGAFVGLADDINTFSLNPAGLALLEHKTISANFAQWLVESSHNFASFGIPWGRGTVAFGLLYFDQGSVRKADNTGFFLTNNSRASAYDFSFVTGYAHPVKLPLFGKSYLGINGRIFLQSLGDKNFNSIHLDIGALKFLTNSLSLGGSITNIGTDMNETFSAVGSTGATDLAPITGRLGLGWKALTGERFDLNLAGDLLMYKPVTKESMRFNLGGEGVLYDVLALRAGYKIGEDKGGLGLGFGVNVGDVNLDYAYVDYSDINATHRFTGTMTFGGTAERADRDGDGIADDRDLCPDDPEDKDGYEDQDGCPDPDNDHDGIFDVDDRCPNQPEYYNEYEDEDGCPDAPPAAQVVAPTTAPDASDVRSRIGRQDGSNRFLAEDDPCSDERGLFYLLAGYDYVPPILFDVAKDEIRPEAREALGRIAEIIQQCILEGDKVEIRGHADDRGDEAYNLDLSERRANAVKQYMVANFGIPESKLLVAAAGESEPVVPNTTDCNFQINRRVVFRAIPQQ